MNDTNDPHDGCRIKSVYYWPNGMAMVFCEHGQQMPRYQGPTAEMRPDIQRRLREQGAFGAENWPEKWMPA